MLVRSLFLALVATALTGHAYADSIAGNYQKDDQHVVYISKVTDRTNTYFVNIFTVGKDGGSCLLDEEMKLASGGLVFATATCQVGVTKDAEGKVKMVGSCPEFCKNGQSIEESGFVKIGETEGIQHDDEFLGD